MEYIFSKGYGLILFQIAQWQLSFFFFFIPFIIFHTKGLSSLIPTLEKALIAQSIF